MLKSMTGFGRSEVVGGGKRFTLELKSVNHRFCEVVLRLPRSLSSLEERIRQLIKSRVARGRVDGYLSVEQEEEKGYTVRVNRGLARSYYEAIRELQDELGLVGGVSITTIMSLPEVLVLEENPEDIEEFWPFIERAVQEAVDALCSMRVEEGRRLEEDLRMRVEKIALLNKEIESRAPLVVEEYYNRLSRRLREWLAEGALEPSQLAAEAALFAERSNITEEVVRLNSHIEQMRACFSSVEPVGRKLDFLIQEMNREINTIASKAGDLQISRLVVEVKSELEKIREQVQNIE